MFYAGLAIYCVSFFLPSVWVYDHFLPGWKCAYLALIAAGTNAAMVQPYDTGVRLTLFGGVMNPLMIAYVVMRSLNSGLKARLTIALSILVCVPPMWLSLYLMGHRPYFGHAAWIAGIGLMILGDIRAAIPERRTVDDLKKATLAAHPWLRRAAIGAFIPVALVFGIWLYAGTIPPILGRMVDATTGRAIGGSVCESIESSGLGWTTRTSHFDTFSRNGWFYLGPHFDKSKIGRWIVFNDLSGKCSRDAGMGLDFDFYDVTHTVRSGGYFPVVLEQDERYAGYHFWPATSRTLGFPLFVTVPIIPRLKTVEECAAIRDNSLQEQCRQLNTYLSAMETIAASTDETHASHALELCSKLVPEKVAVGCQKTINELVAFETYRRTHTLPRQ
jgi:hypothetical protein